MLYIVLWFLEGGEEFACFYDDWLTFMHASCHARFLLIRGGG